MTDQGAPAQRRPDDGTPKDGAPDDGWWAHVYEGPAGRLPDTPRAEGGEGAWTSGSTRSPRRSG